MEKLLSLEAERRRRKARRDKFNHKNCTLPTIHLVMMAMIMGLVMMMMMMCALIKHLGRTLTKMSLISPVVVHFFMFLTHITPQTCCVGEGKEYE